MKATLAALLIALVAFAAPAARAQTTGGPGDAGIYSTVLGNGLHVVVVEDKAAPVVQVSMWYHFGSLDETRGKTGLAHALEHMMFRGTSDISSGGLDDIVARLGAQMNAQTTYDYTQFYFVVPADKVGVMLDIEADRMQHLALRQADWQVERQAVLNEYDGDESSPFFNLLEKVRAAAYPGEPEGRVPLGVRTDITSANASDIATYYHEWYAPNNATLLVSGDVDHNTLFAAAKRSFGSIASRKLPSRKPAALTAGHGISVASELPFPFEVVDLAYAIPGDTERGEPEMSTLATLINSQRSPFYQSLVQSNIALAIEAQSDTQLKGGLFNVFVVLNPGHHADEAQTVFQSTMDHAIAEGFDADLVRASIRMTIAERMFSADSVPGMGDLVGYTYGIVGEKISDEDARLAALTPAAIQQAAKTYLAQPNVVGHLSPNAEPPAGSSQKSDAAASDNFSQRVPAGPIVMPPAIAAAVKAPTSARSALTPTQFTLPNGIHVIVQEKHDRPTFELRGEIESSQAFVAPGKEGIVRLANAVADYGSDKYGFLARRKATDDLGSYVTTGQAFTARGMARDFSAIAAIVADGEEHPSFAEPWFSIQRDQLANSLHSEDTISGVMVDHAYQQLLLSPEDPSLRRPSALSVSALSADDLRAFTQKYWRPDLTTIAVTGDVTPSHVRDVLTAAFADWHASGPRPSVADDAIPQPRASHAWVGTDAQQVYVRMGQRALARTDKDYATLQVLSQILAGSGAFESRLWQELRQKRGLVYNVTSTLSADRDRGDIRIELNTGPNRVEAAVRLVRDELRRMQTGRVTEAELQEAKGRLVSNALLDEASIDGQTDQILDIASNDLNTDYYRTINERFSGITAADVQRVAQRVLRPDALIEVFAGPSGPWAHSNL